MPRSPSNAGGAWPQPLPLVLAESERNATPKPPSERSDALDHVCVGVILRKSAPPHSPVRPVSTAQYVGRRITVVPSLDEPLPGARTIVGVGPFPDQARVGSMTTPDTAVGAPSARVEA